jgi:hypothetical protein
MSMVARRSTCSDAAATTVIAAAAFVAATVGAAVTGEELTATWAATTPPLTVTTAIVRVVAPGPIRVVAAPAAPTSAPSPHRRLAHRRSGQADGKPAAVSRWLGDPACRAPTPHPVEGRPQRRTEKSVGQGPVNKDHVVEGSQQIAVDQTGHVARAGVRGAGSLERVELSPLAVRFSVLCRIDEMDEAAEGSTGPTQSGGIRRDIRGDSAMGEH